MELQPFHLLCKDFPPFTQLTEEQLRELSNHATPRQFSKNQWIFHEDAPNEDVKIYFLVNGLARNLLHKKNGSTVSLRFYYPGDLLGLVIAFAPNNRTYSVQAMEHCVVYELNKATIMNLMKINDDFSTGIWNRIGESMKSVYDEMKDANSGDDDQLTLLRTRVDSLMWPVHTIKDSEPLSVAAKEMIDQSRSGLIVLNGQNQTVGMITQKDLLRSMIVSTSSPTIVKEWMKPVPFSLQWDAFAYEALSIMKNEDLHVLPVYDGERVVGMLTPSSFLYLNESPYLNITHQVVDADTSEELHSLGSKEQVPVQTFIQDLLDADAYAFDVTEVLTKYHDQLYRRTIQLAEKQLEADGLGKPPIPYAFIVMGSQARREQTFYTDQDNGIILSDYEHLANKKSIENYFLELSKVVNERLVKCGFPLCKGGIMANHSQWRKSLSAYKDDINRWMKEIDAEEIQAFTMLFDFRPVYGDHTLAKELRKYVSERAAKSLVMQQHLMKDALRYRLPSNPFGLIKQKDKVIHVKTAGLMQLVYAVRIQAIKYGIMEVSTIKRLEALKREKRMHPRDAENAKTALHYFLSYRLQNELKHLNEGTPLKNEIPVVTISKEDRAKWKEAIQVAHRMHQVIKISFNRNRVGT
ncbi:DUF294 nucleotidyltransferase-like domain-containing protein [Mangrovibacillus cuniculi]|uniref:Cyclic nucleotide-binding domain-containing protein n=1 Tax=Mangrovibacillus cuniculi TaxID=2593652 RepID=A0A7S8CAP6_9BACI|nr:DUF294 nucleotidyltransferase-like domain-containing protein [Mangrovibacillus cuniculi]QPC46500.1 cyclic nucleotide-binding domain-containing protein [Mangrovibacillus cuniculi]